MSSPSFFERNRLAILAGVAAAAAAGGALWYASQAPAPAAGNATGDAAAAAAGGESTAAKPKNKKKKKSSSASKSTTLSHGFPTESDGPDGPLFPVIDDLARAVKLSEKDREELADEFKAAGNYSFTQKDYERAIEHYDRAVALNDKNPLYYSNRAAVYGVQHEYQKVVEETSRALELKPDLLKGYSRRGFAYESLEKFDEAVLDFTAGCILSNFEDQTLGRSVDRVLEQLAQQIVANRFPDGPSKSFFPSPSFIHAYLSAFHKRALPAIVENADEGTGEYDLKLAFDAMDKENLESYKQAFEYLNSASEKLQAAYKANKTPELAEATALALEYRGTFLFLINDVEAALAAISKSLEVHPVAPAYIKRSTLHVEQGDLEQAQEDFRQAEKLDAQCPDIHYQLAQLAFIQQDFDTAVQQYEASLKLDNSFLLAHIQLAVTKYRMGKTEVAKRQFQKLLEKHPDNSNAHNYYGEILLDLKDVDGAIKEFERATEIEQAKKVASMNVLPLINKALALAQRGQPEDVIAATELCKKAVELDPLSDVAIGSLAQFYLQQAETAKAVELFERNAELARTTAEQVRALTFAEAARTQVRVAKERPIVRQRLEILQQMRR